MHNATLNHASLQLWMMIQMHSPHLIIHSTKIMITVILHVSLLLVFYFPIILNAKKLGVHVILLVILVDLPSSDNNALFDPSFQVDNNENNESNANIKSSLVFPFDLFDQKTKNNVPFHDFNASSDVVHNDDTNHSAETTNLLQNDNTNHCIVNLIEKMKQHASTNSQHSSTSSHSEKVELEENTHDSRSMSSTHSIFSGIIENENDRYSNTTSNTFDNSTKDNDDTNALFQKLSLEGGESYCDVGSC